MQHTSPQLHSDDTEQKDDEEENHLRTQMTWLRVQKSRLAEGGVDEFVGGDASGKHAHAHTQRIHACTHTHTENA